MLVSKGTALTTQNHWAQSTVSSVQISPKPISLTLNLYHVGAASHTLALGLTLSTPTFFHTLQVAHSEFL